MQKSDKTVSILKDVRYQHYKKCNMYSKCLRNSTFKRMNMVWHVLKFIPQQFYQNNILVVFFSGANSSALKFSLLNVNSLTLSLFNKYNLFDKSRVRNWHYNRGKKALDLALTEFTTQMQSYLLYWIRMKTSSLLSYWDLKTYYP